MNSLEPMATLPSGTADAMLDALPHPVIMVAADGRVANANAAAESFFEASLPMLKRQMVYSADFQTYSGTLPGTGQPARSYTVDTHYEKTTNTSMSPIAR